MSPGLLNHVFDAWERGAGLNLHEQADIALAVLDPDAQPGVGGAARLPLWARDAALLRLRRTLFGPDLDGVVRCPDCLAEFDLPLDLDLIDAPPEAAGPLLVESDGYAALVRAPESGDFAAIDPRLPQARFAEALFRRCVEWPTRGGKAVGVDALPPNFRTAAAAALSARRFESPSVHLTCGECGHAWRAPIDIARTFLQDLNAWVARVLDDVHRIASAYHWSERDILAMPLRRRMFYLEAIG